MYVVIDQGPATAIIPKRDFAGTEWAGMSKKQTNAALRARIKIAIAGLRAVADAHLNQNPSERSHASASQLAAFFQALEQSAYKRGKW
jgi:hypothetical protein